MEKVHTSKSDFQVLFILFAMSLRLKRLKIKNRIFQYHLRKRLRRLEAMKENMHLKINELNA